jgi:hypothetical protein
MGQTTGIVEFLIIRFRASFCLCRFDVDMLSLESLMGSQEGGSGGTVS